MSDATEIYGRFGQTLAVAEATLNKLLERHLAAHDTPPNRWYALKLIAQGEPIARPALVDALAAGGKVQPVDAEPLLRTLTADRLVAGNEFVSLTDDGRRSFEELRQVCDRPNDPAAQPVRARLCRDDDPDFARDHRTSQRYRFSFPRRQLRAGWFGGSGRPGGDEFRSVEECRSSRFVSSARLRLLEGAPAGWAREMLRDGEIALLGDQGLAAVDEVAHELGQTSILLVRSEADAAQQDATVIAYAESVPIVWVAGAFSEKVRGGGATAAR